VKNKKNGEEDMIAVKTKTLAPKVVSKTKGFVAGMDIFKNLPPVRLAEVEKKMVEKKYAKGEVIHLEGDPAESVWFVKEGHVKAMVYTPNGRSVNLCVVGSKGMFGSCCSLSGGDYPCQGVAETDTVVYSFPMKDFLELLNQYPEMSRSVVEMVSKRLRYSKETQLFEQESVEKRILHVLTNMVEEFGTTIPMTRREIAEMAGTTVETCIRTFSTFEEEGLVSTERGKITIVNKEAIADRMDEI
jgi:CRP/FNR family transcriptional regulator